MKNGKAEGAAAPAQNPLDRPLDGPIAPIPGLDVDPDEEATARVWGVRRPRSESASSEFERVVEYTDWRADAAKEGPYSKGHARSVYRGSNRLDNVLGFPGIIWLAALYDRDWGLTLLAAACWIIALMIWTPWTLWRVAGRNPKGDTGRAGRRLAIAWGLLILFVLTFTYPSALTVTFPFVYGGGLILLYLALTVPPAAPPRAP